MDGPDEAGDVIPESFGDDAKEETRSLKRRKVVIPQHQWNDLWLTKFCITHNLGRDAQDDLREWVIKVIFIFILWKCFLDTYYYFQRCGNRESNLKMSTARTIYGRIKSRKVYPDVQEYKLSKEYNLLNIPDGFHSAETLTFKFADIMEVMLLF